MLIIRTIKIFLISMSFINASEITDLILKYDELNWNDGTLEYKIDSNNSFVAYPINFSGRTIDGKWYINENGLIVIIGKWEWVNGMFMNDDYRKMTIFLRNFNKVDEKEKRIKPFFLVEYLTKLTPDEYKTEIVKCEIKK